METNEHHATVIEKTLREKKKVFLANFEAFLEFEQEEHPLAEKQKRLKAVHREAIDYYNEWEQSIADSELLGAHRSAGWVRTKAETSLNALDSIYQFHQAIGALASKLSVSIPSASPTAYASMQRIVKRYFPQQAIELRDKYLSIGLPVLGFDGESTSFGSKATLAAISLGVAITLGMIIVLISTGQRINSIGFGASFYYILLVILSASISLLIFGSVRSYAKISHSRPGLAIELGGPAALFAIIVGCGIKLAPVESVFSTTIRVYDKDNHLPIRSGNGKGKVFVELDQDTREILINDKGEGDIKQVPNKFKEVSVAFYADIPDYEIPDGRINLVLSSSVKIDLKHRTDDPLDKAKVSLVPGTYSLTEFVNSFARNDINITFDETVSSVQKKQVCTLETNLKDISVKQALKLTLPKFSPNLFYDADEKLIVIKMKGGTPEVPKASVPSSVKPEQTNHPSHASSTPQVAPTSSLKGEEKISPEEQERALLDSLIKQIRIQLDNRDFSQDSSRPEIKTFYTVHGTTERCEIQVVNRALEVAIPYRANYVRTFPTLLRTTAEEPISVKGVYHFRVVKSGTSFSIVKVDPTLTNLGDPEDPNHDANDQTRLGIARLVNSLVF